MRFAHTQQPRAVVLPPALDPHLAPRLVADPVLPDPRLSCELVCVLGLSIADTGELDAGPVLSRGIDGQGVAVLRGSASGAGTRRRCAVLAMKRGLSWRVGA